MSDNTSNPQVQSREYLSQRTLLAFSNSNLKVELLWPSIPVTDELISAYLIFFDRENRMVDVSEFEFAPTMPDMGHGTSPVTIFHLSQGLYRVDDIFFSMPGRWFMDVFLNDSKQSVRFEVNL